MFKKTDFSPDPCLHFVPLLAQGLKRERMPVAPRLGQLEELVDLRLHVAVGVDEKSARSRRLLHVLASGANSRQNHRDACASFVDASTSPMNAAVDLCDSHPKTVDSSRS